MIGRVLLLGFNEDVIDDVLAAHLEHLLGCFIALKHVIKFVYLILHRGLNLYLVLAQILHLLILLHPTAWLEFNQHLTHTPVTLSLSSLCRVCPGIGLLLLSISAFCDLFLVLQRGDSLVLRYITNTVIIAIIIKHYNCKIIIRSSIAPSF